MDLTLRKNILYFINYRFQNLLPQNIIANYSEIFVAAKPLKQKSMNKVVILTEILVFNQDIGLINIILSCELLHLG